LIIKNVSWKNKLDKARPVCLTHMTVHFDRQKADSGNKIRKNANLAVMCKNSCKFRKIHKVQKFEENMEQMQMQKTRWEI